MKFTFELSSKGYIKQRESFDMEFKEAFHFGDSLAVYVRTLVGMANHKGGEIIFGIKDSPREPIGLKNNKFEECDPRIINQFISEHFSHEVDWQMETHEIYNEQFGRLWVEEATEKPIICSKFYKSILRESAIYYRYRAETKEIRYPELSKLLIAEKEKEKLLWIKHIEKISQVGPQNIHLIDTFNGEIQTGKGKILLDKSIAEKLKFIKEGHFTEKDGAPALKLIGEITGVVDTTNMPQTDVLYPYRFTDFKTKLGVNNYEFQAVLWKLKVKGNNRYHTEISNGKKSSIHKYSESFLSEIEESIHNTPNWIEQTKTEYKSRK